ncbi:MAG: DegT/DnrJ/EryC1/StrS family aminotransferase [Desulfovibrio sp.]|nr:DegT/DnrJ/EryC1/StrS family aminotransferase [Desulfovibrio sp.]
MEKNAKADFKDLEKSKTASDFIPYLDLKKINARIHDEIVATLENMLQRGRYIHGAFCEKFAQDFAAFCGVKYALGVGNGLDALRILLEASELGAAAEIIVPANTFIATILAILQAKCKPVLVEPNPRTFNLDPGKVLAAITPKTKAIMAVHLYGRMAPMPELRAMAREHGLKIFEDAAQAHGAVLEGRRAGAWSDAAGFSFYPGKNLGALGDGGMITTNDSQLFERAKRIANYGSSQKYEHELLGCNSRLDEFQAAILDCKLSSLEADNLRRRAIAKYYSANIKNKLLTTPLEAEDPRSVVWHIYPILVQERERFRNFLLARKIETMVHYPLPPHRQKALARFSNLQLPITCAIHEQEVSLPCHPVLTDLEVERVVEACNAWK